jgi:hypothetical protein
MSPRSAPSDPEAQAFTLPIPLGSGGAREAIAIGFELAGVVVFMVAIFGVLVTVGPSKWTDLATMRRDWTIEGPACPIVPAVSKAGRGARPPPPFTYQGVRFAYQIADASCEAVPEGYLTSRSYPVCQFDAPGAVAVTTGGRTVIFEPGVGRRATVTVRDGRATCVEGGWFRPGPSPPG